MPAARYSQSCARLSTTYQNKAVTGYYGMEQWIVLVLLATAAVSSTCSANGDNVSCISATFPVVLLDGLAVNRHCSSDKMIFFSNLF